MTWYLIRMLETAPCFIQEQNPQLVIGMGNPRVTLR